MTVQIAGKPDSGPADTPGAAGRSTGLPRGTTAPRDLVQLPVGDGQQRTRRRSLAVRLVLPIGIFAAWWILTGTGVIPPTTLSTPSATWDAFVQLLLHEDLIGDVGISVRRALLGLALGAGTGLILGIIVGLYRLGEELLDVADADAQDGALPRADLPLHRLVRRRRVVPRAPHRPGHVVPDVPQHVQRRAERGPACGRGGAQASGCRDGSSSGASSCRSPCRPS